MSLDTVSNAERNPDVEQPYAELGLKDDEYARIRKILGRRPTSSELAMYSVMWSEHCSYKSSKVHLRQFGEKKPVPSVDGPVSASTACSGCGMIPTTLPASLRMAAMSRCDPFGLPFTYRATTRPCASNSSRVCSSATYRPSPLLSTTRISAPSLYADVQAVSAFSTRSRTPSWA